MSDKPVGNNIVFVRRVALCLRLKYIALERIGGGQMEVGLVGRINHKHLIAVGDEPARGDIHFGKRYAMIELLNELQIISGGSHRFGRKEMTYGRLHEVAVVSIVTFGISPLGCFQLNGFGARQFRFRKSVSACLLKRSNGSIKRTLDIFLSAAQ